MVESVRVRARECPTVACSGPGMSRTRNRCCWLVAISTVCPAPLWLFIEFGAVYKYSDLLTYLLTSPIPLLHCTLPSSRFFQFYLAIFLRNRLLYRPTVQYFERILSKVSYCVAAARHSLFYFRPLTANCGDVFTLSIFRDAASSALHESALERTILDWYQPSRVSYLVDRSAYNVHFISASFIRYL